MLLAAGQPPVLLIQDHDLALGLFEPRVIIDNVIRYLEARFPTGLRGQNTPRLFDRFRVARQQSLKLHFLFTIND